MLQQYHIIDWTDTRESNTRVSKHTSLAMDNL